MGVLRSRDLAKSSGPPVSGNATYRELGQGHVPREGQTLRRKQGLSRGRPQGLLSQSFSAAVRQASCENWVP
jgi:hypothetical protein